MIERVKVAGSTVIISKIGFGCGRIYAGSEIRSSARLIEAALTAGIRHFDTAPMYGLGLVRKQTNRALVWRQFDEGRGFRLGGKARTVAR